MKNKVFILVISFVTYFSFISNVEGACNLEESKEIQSRLDQIKITYEHIEGLVDSNNEILNGVFKINITGLTDGLVLYNEDKNILIVGSSEGKYEKFGFIHGTYEFRLYPYDTECTTAYRTIKVSFPRYNSYSDSYLCNGIDSTKFLPCNKWYEYDLDEETFMARLKEYKDSENKKKQNIIYKTTESVSKAMDSFSKNFIKFWYIYLIGIIILGIGIVYYFKYYKKNNKKKKKKNR